VNADRNQQEQLQEKNEASTQQMEQQMRQSPGSVTQQQINNKVTLLRLLHQCQCCLSSLPHNLVPEFVGDASYQRQTCGVQLHG